MRQGRASVKKGFPGSDGRGVFVPSSLEARGASCPSPPSGLVAVIIRVVTLRGIHTLLLRHKIKNKKQKT